MIIVKCIYSGFYPMKNSFSALLKKKKLLPFLSLIFVHSLFIFEKNLISQKEFISLVIIDQ